MSVVTTTESTGSKVISTAGSKSCSTGGNWLAGLSSVHIAHPRDAPAGRRRGRVAGLGQLGSPAVPASAPVCHGVGCRG